MSKIYRTIVTFFVNGWAWWLDYIYVAYWQIYGFLIHLNHKKYIQSSKSHNKIPILLIPGIYENWQFMKPVADALYQQGHPIHIIDSLGYNTGEVEAMATIVDAYISQHNLHSCLIVAHSKGGLIGKYVLTNFNSQHVVKGMIALNTPFSGSRYAYLLPLKSTRMFIPNSPILSTLTTNTVVNAQIISIYGLFDPHIPKGSFLEGAQNIQLKTRGHFRIMNNKNVHRAIIKSIDLLK
jgi:triacylglycerol lipase